MADGNNPFMPVKFVTGPPTKVAWEDGPGAFVTATGAPIYYNGQVQSPVIANANPKPPRQTHPAAAGNDSKIK